MYHKLTEQVLTVINQVNRGRKAICRQSCDNKVCFFCMLTTYTQATTPPPLPTHTIDVDAPTHKAMCTLMYINRHNAHRCTTCTHFHVTAYTFTSQHTLSLCSIHFHFTTYTFTSQNTLSPHKIHLHLTPYTFTSQQTFSFHTIHFHLTPYTFTSHTLQHTLLPHTAGAVPVQQPL